MIARGHGLAFPAVARANNIVDPNIVRLGRVLILPTRVILPAVRDEGIVINLPECRLFVFRGGVVKAVYPATIGLPTWRTPIGPFTITTRVQNPAWYMPPELAQRENIKREVIPPGLDNPLGDFWIGTSIKHTGIHSTNSPMTIGRALSHGCIRLYPEHAKILFGEVKIGDTGEIVYKPVKVAIDNDDVLVEVHPDVYGLVPDLRRSAEEQLRAIGAWEKIDPALLRRVIDEAGGIPVTVRVRQGRQTSYEKIEGRDSLRKEVDRIFGQWDKADSPGCALAIINKGEFMYKRGYGMAKLEPAVPIVAETLFNIGSMSKQFTAASIILLAEGANISLDDDIRRYLPEFPDYGDVISIRHLLHHTSGIRDYAWLMLLGRKSFQNANTGDAQRILELITRQKHLYFRPGQDYYYSNSNYLLLALIIERVTGSSLAEYERMHIFEPLGMRHTFVREDAVLPIEHAAQGYVKDTAGGYHTKDDWIAPGPGGVYSTVGDLFLWDQNFNFNKIGGKNFNATMITPAKLNNGEVTPYACGLEVDRYRGLKTIGHKGFTESFDTYMVRFPDQDFSIICLANVEVHSDRLSMRVADLYLGAKLEPEAPQQPQPEPVQRIEVTLDPSVLDLYVGAYRFDFGLVVTIKRENGKLLMEADKQPTVELSPESKTDFSVKTAGAQISFNEDESGSVTGLSLTQMGRKMQARRIESAGGLSPQQLSEYVGHYYSDELEVTYSIMARDGQLIVTAPNAFESPMLHVEGDTFAMTRGDMIFHRNDKGRVSGFLLEVKTERLSFEFTREEVLE